MMRALNVVFRVDASLRIGNGHLMRCLTLAKALREQSAKCSFVCRAHAGHLGAHVMAQGFPLRLLPPGISEQSDPEAGYAGWLGSTQAEDARLTRECLAGAVSDCMVVDHYSLDEQWERELRPNARRIMVIDDLANRNHDCDLLLDQNLGSEAARYAARIPGACRVFAGPRYALLRGEFARQRQASLSRRKGAGLRSVLVSLGGVDRNNVTGRVLAALAPAGLAPGTAITVVLGPHAPAIQEVRAMAAASPLQTRVLVDVNDMAELMAEADLAIGAAGASAWERCCLGLPSLLMVLADNQLASAKALERAGAAWLIGGPDVVESRLRAGLEFAANPERLRDMQVSAAALVDGAGTSRIVEEIGNECA